LKPLAACLAATFALVSYGALASAVRGIKHEGSIDETGCDGAGRSWAIATVVDNCNESGTGSLRNAVHDTVDGGTVDLSGLHCSSITLDTGAIDVAQASLTLIGPDNRGLAIDAHRQTRIFSHTGSGVLRLYSLVIQNGYTYESSDDVAAARGGCISSSGSVFLSNSEVKACMAKSTQSAHGAAGGAVYARTAMTLSNSFIHDSSTRATGSGSSSYAKGGGVSTPGSLAIAHSVITHNDATGGLSLVSGGGAFVGGNLTATYSTISSNYGSRFGGGLYTRGGVDIRYSTLSGNSASSFAAAYIVGNTATSPIGIRSSTISGNSAMREIGGIRIKGHDALIANSTIAFNTENYSVNLGSGLSLYDSTIALNSTIIANNTNSLVAAPDDVSRFGPGQLIGAHNLIGSAIYLTPPPDTISSDPLLAPLADNGGATLTHALQPGSPAIDKGNNDTGATNDQRGPSHARVVGPAADIGAFERNADIIFANGFG
jgi:hypothetical protein